VSKSLRTNRLRKDAVAGRQKPSGL
jgi:hypothetical protein